MEAGARGYLLKDAPADALVEAVRLAARGETVLSPSVVASLVSRVRSPGRWSALPSRELQVVREVAQGRSNVEIDRLLHIGEATVKTHLLRTFVKLGVEDRTRAVTMAMERGPL